MTAPRTPSLPFRFAYATGPVLRERHLTMRTQIAGQHPAEVLKASHLLTYRESAFRPVNDFPFEDDAFGTIMQWLYHRINETR